jgi:signal transduction histidine kinase
MTYEAYKILIVDDEELNLKMLSRLLSIEKYSLYTAGNGEEAVALAKRINPDLVILDVLMPVLDGVETCRILKSTEETRQIPVIMLTAHPGKDTLLRCLMAGANDFLAKPVDNVELQLRVSNLLEFKRHAETRKQNEILQQNKTKIEDKNRELEAALQQIEKAQEQIIQQEKMATIGQMAAGVAHEINNPIGFISSNLNTLGKYVERFGQFIALMDDVVQRGCNDEARAEIAAGRRRLKIDSISQDIHQLIEENIEGTERVKTIVLDLKNFSRIDNQERKTANLNTCLDETLRIVWNELKYKTTVIKEYGELPETECYPQQLNQVFVNILANAAQAIVDKGEIRIRTWATDASVFIAISDNGPGMPQEIRNRLFEPFFTTKEVGKGTGLGLSISYDIVKKHGGDILVDSQPAQGTTFTVRIPVGENR